MFTHSISLFAGCSTELYNYFWPAATGPLTEHMTCADAENPASKKHSFLITAVNVIIVEVNNL